MNKFLCATLASMGSLFAIESTDEAAIFAAIRHQETAWNESACQGFADYYAKDANFVNIFGDKFSGREAIEARHLYILEGFLKGSKLHFTQSTLREVHPGLVVALIDWDLDFEKPCSGVFTQVFVKQGDHWEITSAQNTLKTAR